MVGGTSNARGVQPKPPGIIAELIVFAIIAAFVWPVVAVGVVGGYGLVIWMSQLVTGPPGPPGL